MKHYGYVYYISVAIWLKRWLVSGHRRRSGRPGPGRGRGDRLGQSHLFWGRLGARVRGGRPVLGLGRGPAGFGRPRRPPGRPGKFREALGGPRGPGGARPLVRGPPCLARCGWRAGGARRWRLAGLGRQDLLGTGVVWFLRGSRFGARGYYVAHVGSSYAQLHLCTSASM